MRTPHTDGEDAAGRGQRVALRDGGHALVRPLREQDRPSVVSLIAGLSPESRAQRFHLSSLHITPAVIDLVTAGRALVATREGRVVALASYHPQHDPTLAEVAIVVADAEQRHGIGTALCRRLIRDARCAGICRLIAEIEGSNRGMLALLRALDLPMTHARAWGVITVEVVLCPGPEPPRARPPITGLKQVEQLTGMCLERRSGHLAGFAPQPPRGAVFARFPMPTGNELDPGGPR